MVDLSLWTAKTCAGFNEMAHGRAAHAAEHWAAAGADIPFENGPTPVVAAMSNNSGAGHLLLGRQREARSLFERAEASWVQAIAEAREWDVSLASSSSAFHIALASRNLTAFQNARRRPYAQLCAAALAITRFNLVLASGVEGKFAAIADALATQLEDSLGPDAADVGLLRISYRGPTGLFGDDSPYSRKIAAFDAMRTVLISERREDDWRNVEAAVALTVLLHPDLAPTVECDTAHSLPSSSSAGASALNANSLS